MEIDSITCDIPSYLYLNRSTGVLWKRIQLVSPSSLFNHSVNHSVVVSIENSQL